jgi:hypothetical protein
MSPPRINKKSLIPVHIKTAQHLYKKGYSVVNVSIYHNKKNNRKGFVTPKDCTSLTYEECKQYIGSSWTSGDTKCIKTNGLMLLTGIREGECDNLKHCVCIDVDNPKDDEINGMKFINKYKSLFKNCYEEDTANGGKHYIFSLDKDEVNDPIFNNDRFEFNGKCYSIDILANSKKVILAPSAYNCYDELKEYTAVNDFDNMQTIPSKLFKMCNLNKRPVKPILPPKKLEVPTKCKIDLDLQMSDQEAVILIKLALRHDIFKHIDSSYNTWSRVGFIINNVLKGDGVNIFTEVSKNMNNFKSDEDVIANYNSFPSSVKNGQLLTFKTLIKIFKDSHTLKSKKIMKDYNEFIKKIETTTSLKNCKLEEKYYDKFSTEYFNTLSEYCIKKKYFEVFVCKVLRPDGLFIYTENDIDSTNNLPYTTERLTSTFSHLTSGIYNDKGIDLSFVKIWLADPQMRVSNELIFKPYNGIVNMHEHKLQSDSFNLFNGYDSKIISKYDTTCSDTILKPFKSLVYDLVGADQVNYDYFMNYMAHMIQKPQEKMRIAMIIKSNQGVGKNITLNCIKNIIGSCHFISSSKSKDFFGEHAEGLFRKLLVNLNEAEAKDTMDYEGLVKECITEEYLTVNPKFVRPITFENFVRLIITTNKNNSIKIDIKSGDRRFVVFESTDKFLDKTKFTGSFWSKLVKHFNSSEFIACLYDHLNGMDITKFNQSKRPITEAYKMMATHNIPAHCLFIEEYITKITYDKKTGFVDDDKLNDSHLVKSLVFYDKYIDYCHSNGILNMTDTISNKKFTLDIMCEKIDIEKIRKNDGIYFKFCPKTTLDKLSDKGLVTNSNFDKLVDNDDNNDGNSDDKDLLDYF